MTEATTAGLGAGLLRKIPWVRSTWVFCWTLWTEKKWEKSSRYWGLHWIMRWLGGLAKGRRAASYNMRDRHAGVWWLRMPQQNWERTPSHSYQSMLVQTVKKLFYTWTSFLFTVINYTWIFTSWHVSSIILGISSFTPVPFTLRSCCVSFCFKSPPFLLTIHLSSICF